MELVVRGRNVEVPDHFRAHVAEKFARVERYDARILRTDVELLHEKNPRQADICQRVEITCRVRGPVVRAEACGPDFYAALDAAMDKIERRFRRSADRRRVHHGRHSPTSVGAATAGLATAVLEAPLTSDPLTSDPLTSDPLTGDRLTGEPFTGEAFTSEPLTAGPRMDGTVPVEDSQPEEGPGRIVREKVHSATPMSIDQALHEMELVGHDFYLFHDAQTDRPSVVYRRHAYDYGVIRLGD